VCFCGERTQLGAVLVVVNVLAEDSPLALADAIACTSCCGFFGGGGGGDMVLNAWSNLEGRKITPLVSG
jgi:hypothetical protein